MSADSFQCLACRGGESEPVYSGCIDYYVGKPDRVDYRRCRKCGLVQQSPIPGDVSRFYEAYPVHAPKSLLHSIFRAIKFANYWKGNSSPAGSVLLDYGCGDGSYLATQRDSGLKLAGYEPSPAHAEAVASRLGVPVYSDVEKLSRDYAGKVDVLTMHFVLEHLTDLHAGFKRANELLRPGGTFYFLIPQIDSFESRLFGRKWHNLDAPRHISFPEPPVIQKLADEHGFTLARHKGIPFPNGFAGSVPVVLLGKFKYPIFLLSMPAGIIFSHIVPTGCRAFWLEKRQASSK
jgi:SAM-dependent methyltransferase